MPIIPIPIVIPDDGNKELLIPDAVGVILFGGIITALIGLVVVLAAVTADFLFDKDVDAFYKIAAILTVAGAGAAIIGLVLVLITGQIVEG